MSDLTPFENPFDPEAPVVTAATPAVEIIVVSTTDPARAINPKGSIYLDNVQREEAERIRAKVEGREPDYDNPGTTAGTTIANVGICVGPDTSLPLNEQ